MNYLPSCLLALNAAYKIPLSFARTNPYLRNTIILVTTFATGILITTNFNCLKKDNREYHIYGRINSLTSLKGNLSKYSEIKEIFIFSSLCSIASVAIASFIKLNLSWGYAVALSSSFVFTLRASPR